MKNVYILENLDCMHGVNDIVCLLRVIQTLNGFQYSPKDAMFVEHSCNIFYNAFCKDIVVHMCHYYFYFTRPGTH